MENAKKILITTESHEIFVLRNTAVAPLRSHCEMCGGETEFLTMDEAVCSSRVRTVIWWLGAVPESFTQSRRRAGTCSSATNPFGASPKNEEKNMNRMKSRPTNHMLAR